MTIFESIKYFGSFAASIITLLTLVVFVLKPIRNQVIKSIKNLINDNKVEDGLKKINESIEQLSIEYKTQKKEVDLIKEHCLCTTRNALTKIYDECMDSGYISDYNKENFISMYDIHLKLGGNSYTHQIYDEIMKLPRKSTRQ